MFCVSDYWFMGAIVLLVMLILILASIMYVAAILSFPFLLKLLIQGEASIIIPLFFSIATINAFWLTFGIWVLKCDGHKDLWFIMIPHLLGCCAVPIMLWSDGSWHQMYSERR